MSVYSDYVQVITLAFEQQGVVTRAQLRRLGISDNSIRTMAKVPEGLVAQARGVYVVPDVADCYPWEWERVVFQAIAPALFNSEKTTPANAAQHGALSHYSAALIHGCVDLMDEAHITAPSRHRLPIATCHQAALTPTEITIHEGLPITSLERTTQDLATMPIDGEHLARWIHFLLEDKGWDMEQIAAIIPSESLARAEHYLQVSA